MTTSHDEELIGFQALVADGPTMAEIADDEDWCAKRGAMVLPNCPDDLSARIVRAILLDEVDSLEDLLRSYVDGLEPLQAEEVRPLIDAFLAGEYPQPDETLYRTPTAPLPTTMTHRPNGLGEYRTHRRHMEVIGDVFEVGPSTSRISTRDLRQAADAWLARGNGGELGEYALSGTDDQQWPYVVQLRPADHVLMINGKPTFVGMIRPQMSVGNAERRQVQIGRHDRPIYRKRTGKTSKGRVIEYTRERYEHAGTVVAGYRRVESWVTSFRGGKFIGHVWHAKPVKATDGAPALDRLGVAQRKAVRVARAAQTIHCTDRLDLAEQAERVALSWPDGVGSASFVFDDFKVKVSRRADALYQLVLKRGDERKQLRLRAPQYVAAAIRNRC